MNQRRAQPGGEQGANGDWYAGGQWIANTEQPKRHRAIKPTRRQEIEARVWALPPRAGMRSIYAAFASLWGWDQARNATRHPSANPALYDLERAAVMAERWNQGERWFDPDDPSATITVT